MLTPAEIREIAREIGLRPSKTRGQNFLLDANVARRIVRLAAVTADDVVLEIGPGLGSLTLGLLPVVRRVVAVEVEPALADRLARTASSHTAGGDLEVMTADALTIAEVPGPPPTALVANLPYNIATPLVLTMLERLPSLRRGLVMVQAEVVDRLVAEPGSKTYGVPSVKLAWWAAARRAGSVSRHVFWPVPNVDSALMSFDRREPPSSEEPVRRRAFELVDAAFSARRKTLRAALAGWAGSAAAAEALLRDAAIDPGARGESLTAVEFARLAQESMAG